MKFHESISCVDYPFSSRARNLAERYFLREFNRIVPTLGDIKKEIDAGRLVIAKVRGLGKITMGEFIRATGASAPQHRPIRAAWKFNPWTGEEIKR